MIAVKREGILLQKTHLDFENDGVLNPAVLQEGDTVHVFYRAVQMGNISTLGYCQLKGPLNVVSRHRKPVITPEYTFESQGVEDARLTRIDDKYYLTYTAYDGMNALGALATSTDLVNWKKQGIIVPRITYDQFVQLAEHEDINEKYFRYHDVYTLFKNIPQKLYLWDKNVLFFPRRIRGRLYFLHRIRPGIQIVSVNELSELNEVFWEEYLGDFYHHILMDPLHDHESSYIGGGCPPVETDAGWLLIYHGVKDTPTGYIYSACAALLDKDHPEKVIARLPYALLSPEEPWERQGVVNNVIFPTGTAIFDNRLYVYYGGADTCIGCFSVDLSALTEELLTYKNMTYDINSPTIQKQ